MGSLDLGNYLFSISGFSTLTTANLNAAFSRKNRSICD
jgi:hypothetical protein